MGHGHRFGKLRASPTCLAGPRLFLAHRGRAAESTEQVHATPTVRPQGHKIIAEGNAPGKRPLVLATLQWSHNRRRNVPRGASLRTPRSPNRKAISEDDESSGTKGNSRAANAGLPNLRVMAVSRQRARRDGTLCDY